MTTLTQPQHMQALEKADRIRLGRAAIKREIKAGVIPATTILAEPPPVTESMAVSELLCAQMRWGETRARKLLSPLGISENRPLGRLTERQRRMLVEQLKARTP